MNKHFYNPIPSRARFITGICLLLLSHSVYGGAEEVWRQVAHAGAISVPNGTNGVYVAYTTDDVAIISGVTLSNTGRGLWLARYDAQGALLWLRNFGRGPSPTIIRNSAVISRIRLDSNNNIFLCGHIAGDTPTLIGTNSFLSPNFYGNAFLAKFDSDGDLLWVRYVPGSDSADFNGLALDSSGNAFLCGQLYGSQTFGSIALSGPGQHGFIAKINASGAWQWVNAAADGAWAFSVAIDPAGNPLVTGYTRSDAQALFGAPINAPLPAGDMRELVFVSKLDSRNGAAIWATGARCTSGYALSNIGREIALLDDGTAYVAGYCIGPAQFGANSLPKTPDVGLFLARITADGAWLWATNGESPNQGLSGLYALAVDGQNNAYVQGQAINNFFYGSGTDGIIKLAGITFTNTAFLAKADPSGSFIFAAKCRSLGNIQAVDPAGHLYWGGDPGLVKFGPAIAPILLQQPALTNVVLSLNDATVLQFTATGAPVYYQWFQNGAPLGDLTESPSTNGVHQIAYSIAQFRAGDIGQYTLVLSNSAGTATSSTIRLALASPQITGVFSIDGLPITEAEPDSTVIIRGMNLEPALGLALGSARLQVSGNGSQEIFTRIPSYYFPDPITVTTPGGTAATQGPFRVILPQASSSGKSNFVGRPHYFYTPPADGFSFQWFKDGAPLNASRFSGSQTPQLTISNLEPSDSGIYTVIASNSGREARSIDLPLAVYPEPPKPPNLSITGFTFNSSIPAGQNTSFSISTSGDGPITWQWFKDGVALLDGGRITGATTATLNIAAAEVSDSGKYYAVLTVPSGSLTSGEMPVTIFAPLIITRHPRDQVYAPAGTATFAVEATGNPPLRYEWKKAQTLLKDDGRILGASDPTLTIHALTTNDVGSYSIRVSDSAGSSTLLEVHLTLPPAPAILRQPLSLTNVLGQTALFSVTAFGPSPLTYQWHKSGMPIPGQTNSTLVLFATQRSDAGEYRVTITNPGGSITSAAAILGTQSPETLQISSIAPLNSTGFRLLSGYGDHSPIDPTSLSRFSISATTNLLTPRSQWQRLTNFIVLPNGQLQLEDPLSLRLRFYTLERQ
jgi:hypothetical protein